MKSLKPIALRRTLLLGGSTLLAVASVHGTPYYWDIDDATAGAGGGTPSGSWATGGTTWSTSSQGTAATPAVTTSLLDDLFFSAGIDATGAFTVDLTASQNLGSLTVQEGTVTISGDGGVLTLGGAGGIIRVANGLTGAALTATIGNNTTTILGGTVGLTKAGAGTLTLNGSAAHTFTGGLTVNGGTLALNFANLATPTDLIAGGNSLAFGGGILSLVGKGTDTTSQTLADVTVNSGGGQLLGNLNGGTALNITLGSLTTTAKGGSLLVGTAVGATSPLITTTNDKDATGIYGGRVAFANGTANTGFDWATTADLSSPFALSAYAGYTAMATSGADTNNSRINATTTLTDDLTTNSLKFESPATAQTLDLAGKTLTLTSGGLLVTGSAVTQGPRISNGTLTAGSGSNYDLVVHQYQANNNSAGGTNNNTSIAARIADNGENPVTLVKAGTGTLLLTDTNPSGGNNSFTGGIIVNGGIFGWSAGGVPAGKNYLNNNSLTFNANSIVLANENATTDGGITINNGSQIDIRNNTKTFTVNGPVTGERAGITLGQNGGGATRLVFNSTANTFTGPIRFAVTPNGGQPAHLTVNSLADSAAPGEGNLSFGVAGTGTNEHIFTYGPGAVAALTLNNRRIELTGGHPTPVLENNSPQAFTINSDLLPTGTGTKNFTLRGTGAGLGTFAGDITNGTITTLNIVKNGSGTWALAGDNAYNGTTTVTAGTLLINGNQSAATGAVAVNGTSTLGGSGTIGGTVTVAATAKLAPGTSVGTLAIAGGLDISAMAGGTGTLNYELNSIGASDKITVTGTLNIGSATLGLGDFAFTNLGGLQAGNYELITSGSPITGPLDAADATGTLGDFAIELKINGTDLELVVTGGPSNDYTDWAASFLPTVIGQPADDHDGDGLTNDDERIFGLNPTSGSSVNPISVPFDSSTDTFSFTRRDPSLTGLIYKLWYSTDLVGWQVDPNAVLTPGAIVNQVQTVAVKPGAGLLDEPKLFLRIGAEEPVPPPPLLSETFEDDNGGFTVATLGGTAWEWGAPNSPTQGGGAVTSGAGGSLKCWATNLTGGYAANTDTSLRSPVIDLTAVSGATLSFAQAIDAVAGHTLVVNVLDDTTDTVIANVIPAAQDPDPNNSPWQTVGPVPIPGAALGRAVRIEWRFVGNGDATYNGVYLDNVTVTQTP